MDFDKTARELLACCGSCLNGGHIPGCAQYKAPTIAAALKAAYNAGLEDAALDMQNKFKVHIRGEKIALYGCAEAVRAKKVPT